MTRRNSAFDPQRAALCGEASTPDHGRPAEADNGRADRDIKHE
ncbi:MAG TPA: hypothetical protein VFO77_12060 [Actinoplanes sp.]|nr:hypothetical protein [Actinoplanes sp.]